MSNPVKAPETINVRGVNFNNITFDDTVNALLDAVQNQQQTALYTPNSEIVQACIEDPALYGIVNSAELIVPDGIGVVKAARILGTPFCAGKIAGYDVGDALLSKLSHTDYTVFFCGGKPGVAEAAAEKVSAKYPGIHFAGCCDGYFKKEGAETDAVIEKINASGADVLFVCLGAPTQEKWIYNNRARLKPYALLGLGGSLDGYAGFVKRAPKVFIKLGLEWFYRLICEPWRLRRMMKLPKFYFGTWMYKLSGKNKKQ